MAEPRFGLSLHPGAERDAAADARHAEELGFDVVTVMDHLPGSRPTFETWTHLTWAAAATGRIHVATNVLGLPYRHPAVIAKMAESLHRLSGGRMILGLGGGGTNAEFAAFGLPARSRGEKVGALGEAVEVLRRLWSGEPATFEGRHYRIEEAQISPAANPPIPLWLGVYGPRALALAGRVADGWIPSYRFAPPERWRGMRDGVRRAAETAGRNPDAFDYAYNIGVRVDERDRAREGVIVGPPDRVAEELSSILRLGVTIPVLWAAGEGAEQRERLAKEVLPQLRRP